jgi:hypothetical protein
MPTLTSVIKEFILLPLILIIFNGKLIQKIFIFFVSMFIIALFTSISFFLARLIFIAGQEYYILRYLFELGLAAVYFFLFMRFGRNLAENLFVSTDKLNWIFYTLGAFLSWFSIRSNVLLAMLQWADLHYDGKSFIIILISICNLFVIFIAISTATKKTSSDYELRIAQEMVASGVDYYKRLDRILQEIHILRHDYKYQMGVIEELAKISRVKYIREFLATIQTYYTKTEPVVYCENMVINAILANYTERFEKNHIFFHVKVVLPTEIPHIDMNLSPLDNYEICIVLGNILENSIEGTMTVPEAQRRVNLHIRLMDGKLLIEEKNTFDGRIVIDKEHLLHFNIPMSRKEKGGGYGLRSIIAVCNRHAGEYLPEWTDSEYTIHILLNL